MFKKFVLLIIAFFITSAAVMPQEVIELNLEKSIDLALENNIDLKQVRLDFMKAGEQVSEAYGTSLFPSIDGSLNYNRALKQAQFFIETPFFSGSFPAGTKNTLTGSISIEQPLFTGAMFLAVKIAETFEEISAENVGNTESDLIARVKESYYNVLLSKELVKLAELNLDLANKNLKDTESLFNAGLVSEYDHLKAKVQYQNIIPAVTEAKNNYEIAKNYLRILTGIGFEPAVTIKDSLIFAAIETRSVQESLPVLFNENRLIRQLQLNSELMDLTASYQFTQHFPRLTLSGGWQSQAQENDREFSKWRYNNSSYIALNLQVPIFKGFSTNSKVEQAELDHKRSLEELRKAKDNLRNELETNLLNINKSREQISAFELAVAEAKKGYDIAVSRFANGLGTQIEVTGALVDFSRSKINYYSAIRDYFVYNARVDHLLGLNKN